VAVSAPSQVATPMEHEMSSGDISLSRATIFCISNWFAPGASRPNSSPPSRAKKSPLPRILLRHPSASRRRRRSPAWWPLVSFTCLKLLTSMLAIEKGIWFRRALSSSSFKRSPQDRRLGRPVSASSRLALLSTLTRPSTAVADTAAAPNVVNHAMIGLSTCGPTVSTTM